MKVNGHYRFGTAESTTVRVASIYRKGLTRYVEFDTLYEGKPVGDRRKVLYRYAKKNWIAA